MLFGRVPVGGTTQQTLCCMPQMLLAFILAFSLALPTPALAYALDGDETSTSPDVATTPSETNEAAEPSVPVEPEVTAEEPAVEAVEPDVAPLAVTEPEATGEPEATAEVEAAAEPEAASVTGFTNVSTGGFLPDGSSARNLALVVRFAGDPTGDGETGYNAPFTYRDDIRTQWEYLIKEFNENNPNAYVKSSFREYLYKVSEGKYDVVTDFPQTNEDGTVTYITLPGTRESYVDDTSLVHDAIIEFNKMYPDYNGAPLDKNGDGVVDNVLIIPAVPEGASISESDILWPHKADYPGSSGLTVGTQSGSPEVSAYNIINTQSFESGVLVHEYLHSLGAKDYYRKSGNGNPVDVWDIMERSAARSWPLALTRQNLGWTTMVERSETGTYTLYEPGTGREQAFIFKSPLSDTEFFVAEYRKKNDKSKDINVLDGNIGGSGLIVYRVNLAYAGEGNISGNDYIYVFRPGETGLGDAAGDAKNAQIAASGIRTSVGNADVSKGITDGALCYSDGRNSGIVVNAVSETDNSLTFTLTYPDYSESEFWGKFSKPDGSADPLGSNATDVQLVSEGSDLYALVESSNGSSSTYRVKKWEDSGWADLGEAAVGLLHGHLAVKDRSLYFLGADYSAEQNGVVLKAYQDGAWREVARLQTGNSSVCANAPTMEFIGSELYVLFDRSNADAKLYRFDSGNLVEASPALPVQYLVAPTLFTLNGHPAVACGDFNEKNLVLELVDGRWVEQSSQAGDAHISSVAQVGAVTYVYQYSNATIAPTIASFDANGHKLAAVELAQFQQCVGGGQLVAAGNRLYLAVVDGDGADDPAEVYSASVSDLTAWEQVGGDVYKPAGKVSAAVWSDKIVVGIYNSTDREAWACTHALVGSGEVDPPQPPVPAHHTAVFKADGAVVDKVVFSEGDTALSRVPIVPEKRGHTGTWLPYTLGTTDLVIEARYTLVPNALTLETNAHVQDKGWIGYRGNGAVVGTTGSSLRMESIRVRIGGSLASSDSISVQAHVQDIGWMASLGNDRIAGTTGKSLRIEAMRLTLSPELSSIGYRVYYRVHAQRVGWMGWAHDGASAGTAGNSLRLEAIQIVLVAPNEIAPTNAYGGVSSAELHPYIDSRDMGASLSSALNYSGLVHIQRRGDTAVSTNGATTLGTTGQRLRLEGIKLSCSTPGVDLTYRTHVQDVGWQNWVDEGFLSGTQGKSLRLEALQIKLTGAAAGSYDVYYRTHVQNIGWTGWARNGQQCGSAGYAYRMEAVQVMIVPKDGAAPGLCKEAFYQR